MKTTAKARNIAAQGLDETVRIAVVASLSHTGSTTLVTAGSSMAGINAEKASTTGSKHTTPHSARHNHSLRRSTELNRKWTLSMIIAPHFNAAASAILWELQQSQHPQRVPGRLH
eukprot:CAMPEP_0204252348 /NCGR_PEP_ID=MMETSP0468-20130131/1131_1 /ASSEMBLY_ACC=CAM_ASM_000383 /TAXON_ID=2969 /ORGANISM="Oxyrrhis marina" /LENGTH=114 /DNA_ID=CAMNT_0051225769 /DNA_START=214 /DNA_END=558 /DNA_ORIENTATION=-